MGVRKDPRCWRRWWDASLNVVSGCEIVDTSCINCYVPYRAAGVQTKKGVKLYLGTPTKVRGKWTWNGETRELAPDHPYWTFPLDWKGSDEPLLGPGKPSLIFLSTMGDLFFPDAPASRYPSPPRKRRAIEPHRSGVDEIPEGDGSVFPRQA